MIVTFKARGTATGQSPATVPARARRAGQSKSRPPPCESVWLQWLKLETTSKTGRRRPRHPWPSPGPGPRVAPVRVPNRLRTKIRVRCRQHSDGGATSRSRKRLGGPGAQPPPARGTARPPDLSLTEVGRERAQPPDCPAGSVWAEASGGVHGETLPVSRPAGAEGGGGLDGRGWPRRAGASGDVTVGSAVIETGVRWGSRRLRVSFHVCSIHCGV